MELSYHRICHVFPVTLERGHPDFGKLELDGSGDTITVDLVRDFNKLTVKSVEESSRYYGGIALSGLDK